MTFVEFTQSLAPDSGPVSGSDRTMPTIGQLDKRAAGFADFMSQFSGCSFGGGVYRVHSVSEIAKRTELALEAFPSLSETIVCFSSDWLGRQYALDAVRLERGENIVLMLEPGTGEVLENSVSFAAFHNVELAQHRDDILAIPFFQRWLSSGGRPPVRDECVGYKVPLFLNGLDDIENLQLVSMEVYWTICAQLLNQVRELPAGTRIGNIEID